MPQTKKAKRQRLDSAGRSGRPIESVQGATRPITVVTNKRPKFSIFSNATGAQRSKRAE
ncbi:MAG: hypothetical protein AB1540_07380 [Bdellovibrionota bacterium]